jgi:hypothetical protein
MDTLREQLDRSFGDGPPLPPVDRHVAAGHRAVRRRRAVAGVTGLATAVVLLTGGYAVSSGSDARCGGPLHAHTVGPAGADSASVSASATPSESPSESTGPADRPWPRGALIRYVDAELEIRPGVIVHERIQNPYGWKPPKLSDALDVTWRGHRLWLMIEKRPLPHGITSSQATPSNGWASFADYVMDEVSINGGSGWPDTFELDPQGNVVPTAGTRVFNRTDDPQLGPDFAPPGATTGAAVVSVAGKDASYFVVWRVIDGKLDVITTPPGDVVGATFEELLSGARAKYASGEGLR